jgi:ornithine decarboxylase
MIEEITAADPTETRFLPGHMAPAGSHRVAQFFAERNPPTPCIVVDLELVRAGYRTLQALLPRATIFYAVKANPAAEVIAALAGLGASFDLASEGEIRRCRELGIPGARLSFGNTVKREAEIAHAHADGIGLFAFDSIAELQKLARAAPGAQVYCRLLVEGKGADWPLSRKFGCAPDMAIELLQRAKPLGLRPVGVSFHVGSQQTDPRQWAAAIASAAQIFHACAQAGVTLELLNLGGGFPAQYRTPVPPLAAYAEAIDHAITAHFHHSPPRLIVEPGRYLAGDAGVLRSTVLLIARKSQHARRRWVYLDAGRYNGLPETLGERIHYRLRTPHGGTESGSVILAGPTCDSTDVIYERADYQLPLDLAIGDTVDFLSAGAYTASYAAVEFNGFPPIRTYCV